MKPDRMCFDCQLAGTTECLFRRRAETIAHSVPPLESPQSINFQMPSGAILSEQALTAARQIADARVEARSMSCPNLNDVDPEYEGRRNL